MLKLHYTEVGLYMEQTMTNPELWLAQRVVLALRLGQPLHLEPGRASFLLPADLPALEQLERALQRELSLVITLIPVDNELVEVSLSGTWVAESSEAHEGLFLTVMSDRSEFLLYRLWQRSEAHLATDITSQPHVSGQGNHCFHPCPLTLPKTCSMPLTLCSML